MSKVSTSRRAVLTGRGAKNKTRCDIGASGWSVRAGYRLGQIDQPGIYPMTLIVGVDGTRKLVLTGGVVEDLGK